jgi:hypothetical protein
MPDSTPGSFRLLGPNNDILGQGATAAMAMAPLPGSTVRKLLDEMKQMHANMAEAKAIQDRAYEATTRVITNAIDRMGPFMDACENKRAEELRQDAEARREAEERATAAYLSGLPDPDSPSLAAIEPVTAAEHVLPAVQTHEIGRNGPVANDGF